MTNANVSRGMQGPAVESVNKCVGNVGEECNDGNTASLDRCSANCIIECGFVCDGAVPQGCSSKCANGISASDEICDDCNTNNGDGCVCVCVCVCVRACITLGLSE